MKQPLGDKVRLGGKGNPKFFTIIGIIKDFHQSPLYVSIEPQIYLYRPSNQALIKLAGGITDALQHTEKVWSDMFPDVPFSYRFLDEQLQDGYLGEQIRGRVFFSLTLLTIFISFLGLFGLASYLATQRIKEIGVRKVLGASVSNIIFLITKDFLLLVFVSAVPAFLGAWYVVTRWMSFPWPWENTIMASKSLFRKYQYHPGLNKREDSHFVAQLLSAKAIHPLIKPTMYIYTYNGNNTWGYNHFQNFFNKSQKLPPQSCAMVHAVLENNYPPRGRVPALRRRTISKGA